MSDLPLAPYSPHEDLSSLHRRSPHEGGATGDHANILSSPRSQMDARTPSRPRAQPLEAGDFLTTDLRVSSRRDPQTHTAPVNNMSHRSGPKDVSSDCTVEASHEEDYRVRMGFVDDYVCAFCDEGGQLICCEGDCGRFFHPTEPDGVHSKCETLGLSTEQVEQLKFMCKNCEYKKHQCVVCGGLGSSDTSSGFENVEVFQCNKKGCNRFYHPECVERDCNKRLQDFECPMHECWPCKKKGREEAGNHGTPEGNRTRIRRRGRKPTKMNLVQCRRCSKAYHRKCLPRGISSRKWETTGGRTLFYCKVHKMVKCLRSATRDHLKFPDEVEDGSGASKKQSVPEGQADHGNKECDHVSDNRDKIPKTYKGGDPIPEQAEIPQIPSGSVRMESLAPESSFPCPQRGTRGFLDD